MDSGPRSQTMAQLDLIPGEPPVPGDLTALVDSLGYLRYTPLRIVRRDREGRPRVVLSFFTLPPRAHAVTINLFWITDPELRAGVARLEAAGLSLELKRRLQSDAALLERFLADQRAYHDLAWRLFCEVLHEEPPRPYPFGVGGVRALDQIKCLHAHLAFHLATGRSWVGAEVAQRLADLITLPAAEQVPTP